MCTKFKKTINIYLLIFYLIIFISAYQNFSYAGDIFVYTHEGRPVPAYEEDEEMSDEQIAWCHYYIQEEWIGPLGLNAVLIDSASYTYNCHGYAWCLSEGNEQVFLGYESYYWTDGAWSNDGQPSYLTASEAEATHAWYNPGDHSVRKIQNSYPRPIEGGRDYVSKWYYYGLYQHAKGHDIYRRKDTTGFDFKKLKTTHYGNLSESIESTDRKTWIGAGGQIHNVSSTVTVPSAISLKVLSGATVKFATNSRLTINGEFDAEGTSSRRITFQSESGSWYGLVFENGSSGYLQCCEINDSENMAVIKSGADVTFCDDDEITLHPGFTVDLGGEFYAYIDQGVGGGLGKLASSGMSNLPYSYGDKKNPDDSTKTADTLLPTKYSFSNNYPNPFNPTTTFKYALKDEANVSIKIYNILGKEVITLVNENQPAGYKSIIWNGMDNSGNPVPSGIYICRITAGNFTKSQKMLLMK